MNIEESMNDSSNNPEIELISTALVNFDRVSAGLALLTKNYQGVLYEVDTTMGMAHAKAARKAIRDPRYEVERVRKGAKAPLIALGKRLDAEATRITNALLTLETPIQEQIEAEETRKEAEKQAAADAEVDRIAKIQARIDEIRGLVTELVGFPPDLISESIEETAAIVIDDSFAEFKAIAMDARDATLSKLSRMRDAAIAQEAEAERVKAERAELKRLRAENEAKERELRDWQELAIENDARLQQRSEVMNPPVSAARGTEAGNLNTEPRHGLGASPRASETRPVEEVPPSASEFDRREIVMVVAGHFDITKNYALALLKSIDWTNYTGGKEV